VVCAWITDFGAPKQAVHDDGASLRVLARRRPADCQGVLAINLHGQVKGMSKVS